MHNRYLIEIHTNTFKYMYPPDTVGGCIRPIFGGKRNHPRRCALRQTSAGVAPSRAPSQGVSPRLRSLLGARCHHYAAPFSALHATNATSVDVHFLPQLRPVARHRRQPLARSIVIDGAGFLSASSYAHARAASILSEPASRKALVREALCQPGTVRGRGDASSGHNQVPKACD